MEYEAEIQVVFIKIYIGTSTSHTHLIRCALDRSKFGLSPEFSPDILKTFLTNLKSKSAPKMDEHSEISKVSVSSEKQDFVFFAFSEA